MFHSRVHESTPHVPIRIQVNSVHALQSYFFTIRFNIILPFACRNYKPLISSDFPIPKNEKAKFKGSLELLKYTLLLLCR